jgi:hypothetical protein
VANNNNIKPTTHQGNLARLPRALAPLVERPQWAIWRWTQRPDGSWQKPPFIAAQPEWHASTKDPNTWTDYGAALAAVQAGHGDGLSYILTENDPFATIDLDHCRDADTHSIDVWAQNFLDVGRHSYSEVTPSGTGCRIWGLADGATLNKKFTLEIDGKPIAAELFRHTNKALTITGYRLDTIRELTNIDKVFDWAVVWAERRKAAAAEATTPANGNGFNGNGSGYSMDEIEEMVRIGAPAGQNRSDLFHTIVGHYVGCGWGIEQILAHLQEFPDGIGARYLREDRLHKEIARSVSKYAGVNVLPLFDMWNTKAPLQPEPPKSCEDDDKKLDEAPDDDNIDDDLDPELDEPDPELDEDEPPERDPNLPPLFAHGDPDARPLKDYLIKHLIPAVGIGLLSGQWGTGKTFAAFDLAGAVITSQPFLGHTIKRRCGVLLVAAEGANEVRLRLEAVIRAKCGGMERAPFRWYETAPMLLQKGGTEKLIAMAKQAEASLLEEFGLPLGLIIVDTIAASAGYARAGDENDPAAGQAVMNVLRTVAQAIGCFVLGVDHFGKNLEAGTRGASSKEAASDVVLACLGDKALSGSVTSTRLAVRKNRGGKQGQEHPFTLREVEAPEPDEDGEPITTMVVDWTAAPPGGAAQPQPDPWAGARREDQRVAALRLKRAVMSVLADQGVELDIPPDGPAVRMVDQKFVRDKFNDGTPDVDGDAKRNRQARYTQFKAALRYAEEKQLIGVCKVGEVAYLWLTQPNGGGDEEELPE